MHDVSIALQVGLSDRVIVPCATVWGVGKSSPFLKKSLCLESSIFERNPAVLEETQKDSY